MRRDTYLRQHYSIYVIYFLSHNKCNSGLAAVHIAEVSRETWAERLAHRRQQMYEGDWSISQGYTWFPQQISLETLFWQ